MTTVETWRKVIANGNSWILFSHGTCVIFLPEEAARRNLREEAVKRLEALTVRSAAVAELQGQGGGWVVNCGDDFIVNYVEHSPYATRYDRISACLGSQIGDREDLKIIHVEIGRKL